LSDVETPAIDTAPLDKLEALIAEGRESDITPQDVLEASASAFQLLGDALNRASMYYTLAGGLMEEFAARVDNDGKESA